MNTITDVLFAAAPPAGKTTLNIIVRLSADIDRRPVSAVADNVVVLTVAVAAAYIIVVNTATPDAMFVDVGNTVNVPPEVTDAVPVHILQLFTEFTVLKILAIAGGAKLAVPFAFIYIKFASVRGGAGGSVTVYEDVMFPGTKEAVFPVPDEKSKAPQVLIVVAPNHPLKFPFVEYTVSWTYRFFPTPIPPDVIIAPVVGDEACVVLVEVSIPLTARLVKVPTLTIWDCVVLTERTDPVFVNPTPADTPPNDKEST